MLSLEACCWEGEIGGEVIGGSCAADNGNRLGNDVRDKRLYVRSSFGVDGSEG